MSEQTIEIKKGRILQYAGDPSGFRYEVESGLLRSYFIDDKGKEHIFLFAPEGWIIADNALQGKPCELFIDALEDSRVIRKEIQLPVNVEKLINRIFVMQKRIIMLMSASAQERYQHFLETYPNIVKRVPQRMIASYLGITPEALSKIKHQ